MKTTTIHPPLTRKQLHNAYAHGFLDDWTLRRELSRLDTREAAAKASMESILCCSGRHPWIDPEDRRRCCAGWRRVFGTDRQDVAGCEYVVYVDGAGWLGWERMGPVTGEAVAS